MKSIELVPGIRSSVLGFGCAPILGSVGKKTARRAIDCAIDCGITHFDLARSYGYGEAESFVGKILKENRDRYVVASKFGIQASWQAIGLRPFKPLIRWGRKLQSAQKHTSSFRQGIINTNLFNSNLFSADVFNDRIPFRRRDMCQSIEKSLRTLGMDYLDYIFVHGPYEQLFHLDELIEAANQLKAQGKIRAFGLALMSDQKSIHESYLNLFDLLQIGLPREESVYRTLVAERGLAPNVLFSAIKGGPANMKPSDKLHLINQDFSKSVILCSMFNEEHIMANSRVLN